MKNCGFQCKIQLQILSAEDTNSPFTAVTTLQETCASDAKQPQIPQSGCRSQEQTSAVAMALPESEPLAVSWSH